ncbi:MAG: glucose-6-phosphate dehydrogenase assembly protein OpcA [Candidatus Limnocylindrales bacterium]
MTSEPMAMVGPSRTWTARASSVAAIEAELARIWGAAARESREAHLSAQGLAAAMGDPLLAGRLDIAGDVGVRMRTSVLTLIAVAERPETEERVLGTIGMLAARHPSRTIVLSPGDPDGPAKVDAHIFAECRIPIKGGAETCTEQILMRTGGEVDQHLSALIQPLLIHDLPVLLWWPDDPPFGRPRFVGLVGSCDRLLVDSGTFHDDGKAIAALHDQGTRIGTSIHDVGWMRLTRWRDVLASLFDHPRLLPELGGVRNLRIEVLGQADRLRPSKAALFAGWLAAVLGWRVDTPLTRSGPSEALSGAFREGRRRIGVEIGAAAESAHGRGVGPGSLMRVELDLAHRGDVLTARVSREGDHLLATAAAGGDEVARRAGRLEPSGEAAYLASVFQQAGQDRMLLRSLAHGVELLGL